MNITDMLKDGMKSMKMPKETTKEKEVVSNVVSPEMPEGDRYPYGLEIRLDEKVLKLIDKEANDFDINQTCTIVAQCEVVQIRSSAGSKNTKTTKALSFK